MFNYLLSSNLNGSVFVSKYVAVPSLVASVADFRAVEANCVDALKTESGIASCTKHALSCSQLIEVVIALNGKNKRRLAFQSIKKVVF